MHIVPFPTARAARRIEPAGVPRLADLIEPYRRYLVGEKRSPSGMDRYCWGLGRVFTWLDGQLGQLATMDDLTHATCKRYKEALGEQGAANATIINALAAIRDFSIWAVGEGLRSDDPTAGIKRPPKKRPDPDPLYEDEIALLLQAIKEPAGLTSKQRWYWRRDALAVQLFVYTGGRLAEIAGLKWKHIKIAAGVIHFRGDSGAKGGKDRTVHIHPDLEAALLTVPEHRRVASRAVVGRPDGQNLTAGGLAKRFAVWLVPQVERMAEQFPELYPHKLRHTFASVLVWNDVDLRTLQELLGHAQLGTTEHYVKVRDKDKRAAIAKFPRFRSDEKRE
jgi:site-specific recombinase XerD